VVLSRRELGAPLVLGLLDLMRHASTVSRAFSLRGLLP
jgi:hypothetical protein